MGADEDEAAFVGGPVADERVVARCRSEPKYVADFVRRGLEVLPHRLRQPGARPHSRAWVVRLGRAGARPRERGVGRGAGRHPRSHQPFVAPGSPGDRGEGLRQPVTATAAMRAARARSIDLGPTRVSSAPTTASNPPGPLPDRTIRARWTAPRRRHSRAREGARSWQATRVTACRNHFPCLKLFAPLNARRSRQSGRARGEDPRDGGATRLAHLLDCRKDRHDLAIESDGGRILRSTPQE